MPTENRSSNTEMFSLKRELVEQAMQACFEAGFGILHDALRDVLAQHHQGEPVVLPARMKTRPFSTVDRSSPTYASAWNACLDEIAKLGLLYTHADPGEVERWKESAEHFTGVSIKATEEVARLRAQLAEAQALRSFANDMISAAYEGGSFYCGDIQDMAVKHGLLRIESRAEECGEACACREYGFPAECYRKTPMLSASAEPSAPVERDEAEILRRISTLGDKPTISLAEMKARYSPVEIDNDALVAAVCVLRSQGLGNLSEAVEAARAALAHKQ